MAEETTTTDTMPETVSRDAHQRMTDERNALKEKVGDLESTVLDLGLVEKARKHFIEKKVPDPEWAADIALASIKAEGEIADIGAYLDDKFARLYPTEEELKTGEGETDDGVPTPDAVEPPGFARPSPASEGPSPGQKKYKISDPEIQALIEANDKPGLEKRDKAGQIEWSTAAPMTPG